MHREGANIEVRVEIEAHPRGARQPSLSSVLSSRSLSVESLAHSPSQYQSQDYLCASEPERGGGGEGREDGGGGEGEGREEGKEEGREEGDRDNMPVFEMDRV